MPHLLSIGLKKSKWISHSLEETHEIAFDLAKDLTPGSILCLYGPLGAGKTAFAKAIIHALTETPFSSIQSPTFSYVIEYDHKPKICHFDLYRLSHEEEFINMGFDEYFDAAHLCIVEWADRIEKILPSHCKQIHLDYLDEESRSIYLL